MSVKVCDEEIEDELPEISLDEILHHNSKEDGWISVYDKVYDVTSYISKHPGSEEVLLEYQVRRYGNPDSADDRVRVFEEYVNSLRKVFDENKHLMPPQYRDHELQIQIKKSKSLQALPQIVQDRLENIVQGSSASNNRILPTSNQKESTLSKL